MGYEILTLPAYRAVGLKWEGKYSEIAPHLKNVIRQMEDRAIELENKVNANVQLGLSYHVIDGGFAHYAGFEVSEEQEIPEGMLEIRVPEWTYVKTAHNKGEEIYNTYSDLHKWLFDNEITPLREAGVEYYDDMPIKHEHYPVDRDRNDEHYEIYIPISVKAATS